MDMIGDLITRIRNGIMRKKLSVKVQKSNQVINILECLYSEGYIRGYKLSEGVVDVLLKYKDGWSVITELKRVSKPSRRVYLTKRDLQKAKMRGEYIVYSCTRGILVNKGEVLDGGEALFSIK